MNDLKSTSRTETNGEVRTKKSQAGQRVDRLLTVGKSATRTSRVKGAERYEKVRPSLIEARLIARLASFACHLSNYG